MTRRRLARALGAENTAAGRTALLRSHAALADRRLADELRKLCYQLWTTEPAEVKRALKAIRSLLSFKADPYIGGVASWIGGIDAITRGKFETAAQGLEAAGGIFDQLGLIDNAAQTKVALLIALGMLGRYEDAISAGREALTVFSAAGDDLAAGKIELNMSNLASRQGRLRQAVDHCGSALRRFTRAGEPMWQAMAENSLANGYMELSDLRRAERHYRSSLAIARSLHLKVTEAEIESSLGRLEMMRGRYSDALASLESSRNKYEDLSMPHQTVIVEAEVAAAYSELNLLAEASELYSRAARTFARLRMRGEEASARLELGRILLRQGRRAAGVRSLTRARKLFESEDNVHAVVTVVLALAEANIESGSIGSARKLLAEVIRLLDRDEDPRDKIRSKLLQGICEVAAGAEGSQYLDEASTLAKKHNFPEAVRQTAVWKGRAARARGDLKEALRNFRKAAEIVAAQRRSLTHEELSIAYVSSRADVITDMVEALIAGGHSSKAFVELDKSRSASWFANGAAPRSGTPPNARLRELRASLDHLYKRLDAAPDDERKRLTDAVSVAEREFAAVDRRTRGAGVPGADRGAARFDLAGLKRRLAGHTTVVEYACIEGEFGAFVVTGTQVLYVPLGLDDERLGELIDALHFQFDALRFAPAGLGRFVEQIRSKIMRIVSEIYDRTVGPLAALIKTEQLVIVPSGRLNYVPFSALWDGGKFLIEKHEVRIAPSAHVWQHLAARPRRSPQRTFLIGFADDRIPLVEQEVRDLAPMLRDAVVRTGKDATVEAFAAEAPGADLIHIACHGEFRADAPLFSNLHLANGWITVRDLLSSRIRAQLVTLSACETGVNKLYPGEELLGLARGFISAGAGSLVVSLWAVNDEAAASLMPEMYRDISHGISGQAALRRAQLGMIAAGADIYHWAPFIFVG